MDPLPAASDGLRAQEHLTPPRDGTHASCGTTWAEDGMDDDTGNVDGSEGTSAEPSAGMVRWRALGEEWEGQAVRGQRRWPVSVRQREPTPSHPHAWIGRVGPGGRGTTVYFDDDPLALRDHVGPMALVEMEEAERMVAETRAMLGMSPVGPRR